MSVSATRGAGTKRVPPTFAWKATVAITGFYAILAFALIPVAGVSGPEVSGFVALFVAVILITELSTSFLLLTLFRQACTWSLLLLWVAYLYSGLMSFSQLLTLPGAVLIDRSLVAVSPQTTAWAFITWVNGFALLAFLSVILEAWFKDQRVVVQNVRRATVIGALAVTAVVVATNIATISASDQLPSLVDDAHFLPQSLMARAPAIFFSYAGIAIILVVIRDRNSLYLWLSLVLIALVFYNVLAAAGAGRFTIGWLFGRLSWIISACLLFVYFLMLFSRQQILLARTSDFLEQHNDNQSVEARLDAAIERLIARENIERYRVMLQSPRDESNRQVLLTLLAGEEAKLQSARRS